MDFRVTSIELNSLTVSEILTHQDVFLIRYYYVVPKPEIEFDVKL